MNKKIKKLIDKECYLCEERDYNVLDVHRIIWGSKYSRANTVTICVKCHRKIHAENPTIIIIGWKYSTRGRILHYIEDWVEKFK